MNGRFLLDTNIVIAIWKPDSAVLSKLQHATEVFIPIIVIGELFFGTYKSGQTAKNVRRVEEFTAANTVLACDTETARWYGRIKNELRAKGRPIPENDLWIAASARQYGLTLVSRDLHFNQIKDLPVETW